MPLAAVIPNEDRDSDMAHGLHARLVVAFEDSPVVSRIIGAAIAVHRALGPGLVESAYERALAAEFVRRGIRFGRQIAIPMTYADAHIECAYRADFVVEGLVIVEVKSLMRLLPVHSAQVLTYLRLTGLRFGLLINFNVPHLRDGIRRVIKD